MNPYHQTFFVATMASPCGPLGLVVDDEGGVRCISFDPADLGRPADRAAVSFRRRVEAAGGRLLADAEATTGLRQQLEEYFAGERRTFDLPLAAIGSPFQLLVWQELRSIPFGTTTSYGEIARRLGDLTLSRAVGAANGANPLPIVVPCHRVIGTDGTLTGFGGGLANKAWLLRHEGARGSWDEAQLGLGF